MSRGPRRKLVPAASRLRPFWLAFVIVVAALVACAYYGASWSGFFPTRVIVSGNHRVPAAAIAARAQILPNVNLWLQNMHAAARRIHAIPYVKDVRIHRSFPAAVHIAVTERTPYAVLHYGRGAMLVDRDLRVLAGGGQLELAPARFECARVACTGRVCYGSGGGAAARRF